MQDNDEFDESALQALLDHAKLLPREIAPAAETWSAIHDRIERSRVRQLTPAGDTNQHENSDARDSVFVSSPKPKERTRLVLGIAAALFISVTTYAVLHERAIDMQPEQVAVAPNNSVQTQVAPLQTVPVQTPVASTSIESVFAQYDTATAELTRDLEQRRSRLQPEAVAVLDSCLTTIDRAIKESRSALADAPENTTIAELLQLTYQQKLDLLRRAADLPLGSL